ncbi:MAG: polysaccharide deacetylase family protein [Candidatus Aenigmatarchaeota archaeon]
MVTVVTSWDEGKKSDVRLAKLLDKHGLLGTFYVCTGEATEASPLTFGRDGQYTPKDIGRCLTPAEIRNIGQRHEIGAHTQTHPRLSELDEGRIEQEIVISKNRLEGITGKSITSFSYPFGGRSDWDERAVRILKRHGFTNARTSGRFCIEHPRWPFAITPTWEAFPRSVPAGPRYMRELISSIGPDRTLVRAVLAGSDWTAHARMLFDAAKRRNDVFHLWGHAWMIDKWNMWKDLDELLGWISGQDIKPKTVGGLWMQQ